MKKTPSRRWLRVVLIVLLVAVGSRITLGLVLSHVVDGLLEPRGLACSWEDLELSPFSGRGELRYVEFAPRDPPAGQVEPVASVDYAVFDLEVWALWAGKLRFQRLEVDGVEVQLERFADGRWNWTEPSVSASGFDGEPAHDVTAQGAIDLSPPIAVEALRVQDVSVRIADRTFDPPVAHSFHLDAAVSNVGHPERRARFSFMLTGDRFLDGAHLQGFADWTSDRIALDTRVQIGGLHPRELAPYLSELGITPVCGELAGRLRARVEANVTGVARDALRMQAHVSDVGLSTDGVDALSLDALFVDVDSISARGATIPRVELLGARARASLESSDRLRFAGLDITVQNRQPSEVPWWDAFADSFRSWLGETTSPWISLLVRDDERAIAWSLGALSLNGGELELVDRRVDPAVELPVFLDELDLRGLAHARIRGMPDATLSARMRMPGLAQSVRVDGSIQPFVPKRAVDVTMTVDDIELDALTGYLRAAGLEKTGQKGGLRLRLTGDATTDACGITEGGLDVEETLTLDGAEATQLGRLHARDLRLDPELRRVRFGDVEIAGSRILFARDPSRRLTSFGLRTLGLSTPAPAATSVSAATGAPARKLSFPRVEIGRLAWQGGQLGFVDESTDPPRRLRVEPLGFELTNLVVGGERNDPPSPPAKLVARAAAPGLFDALELQGTIATKPGRIDLDADLALSGTGLHGPLLAPMGIAHAFVRGDGALRVRARIRREEGWRGDLLVSDARLSDDGTDLFGLSSFAIGDIVLSDDSVEGTIAASGIRTGAAGLLLAPGIALECRDARLSARARARTERLPDGGERMNLSAADIEWRDGSAEPWVACRGITLDVPRFDSSAGVLAIGPASVDGLALAGERDADGVLHALGLRIEPVSSPPLPVAAKRSRTMWPRIELAAPISIALERFVIQSPLARPLAGRVALRIEAPCTVLDTSPQATTPIRWSVDGSIAGLIERWRVSGSARPFAEEPGLDLELAASGVRTQGLVEWMPELAERVRGNVDNGTIEGKLHVELDVRRTGAADSWLAEPFGADAQLESLAFRGAPGGEVLAGIDSIVADVERVDSAHGLVHIRSIDVHKPRGVAEWNGTELSLAGFATTSPIAPPEPSESEPVQRAPNVTSHDTTEVRLDRLTISGVDAKLRDTSHAPAIMHALGGLDVEIDGLSTRALHERVPMRFHASVTAAPRSLAVPIEAGSHGSEPSAPLFEELVASGNLALGPEPTGWVRMCLTGLELPPLAAALAPDSALNVDDGALDLRVDAKLQADSTAKVQSTLVFSDLDLKEPPGGPIESTLSLPVALDAALFLLRNPAGEHRISAGFTVDREGLSQGEIALAATKAVAQVLAVALAGAPLRVINALVPGGGEKRARGPRAVHEIVFAPGSRELPRPMSDALFLLHKEFASNRNLSIEVRHELGTADLLRAEATANPSEHDCRELVTRARQRRAELVRERAVATSQARALLAIGGPDAQLSSERLRTIDRELASVESGLDQVLDILRSNAPARAKKRTRVAALEIAQARLDAVEGFLREGLEPADLKRIEVRSPRYEVADNHERGRVVIVVRER